MGGVDFHPACGGVSSEFAVIGYWVPEVIEVLPVMRCVTGVVVHGMWVEFCVGVGALHVAGVGGLGKFSGDLLCLSGIDTDELTFAGKYVGCIL